MSMADVFTPLHGIKSHILGGGKRALRSVDPLRARLPNGSSQAREFNVLFSEFSTQIKWRTEFGKNNESRIHNMELARQRFNGVLLKPGFVFDFWYLLGAPIPRNGFQAGPTIVRGELVQNYGGGLCQVSSTLFNTFLLGGLEILERHNHSIDLHGEERFIALGQDATVAYGYKNLLVKNTTGDDMLLAVNIDRQAMKFSSTLYSLQEIDRDKISLNHRVVSESDARIIIASNLKAGNQTVYSYYSSYLKKND